MPMSYGFPVETDAYDGPVKRAHERIWPAKTLVGGLVGLAGIVAVASDAYAEPPQQVAYAGSNLSSFGVPDVSGMQPYRTRWLDKTDAIPGDETRMDFYQVGSAIVAHYSVEGRFYAVALDVDGQRPLDHAYVDSEGSGQFEPYPPRADFLAPSWISR